MTDNQPAKSYIETVMARADADLVVRTDAPGGDWGFTRAFFVVDKATGAELGEFRGGVISCLARAGTTAKDKAARDAAEVCAERINAATTLAKIALRAIAALEASSLAVRQGAAGEVPEIVASALADINALAAKGSQ
jgi:hypothetical protein